MPDALLSVGAQGDNVARLHDFLRQRGVELPASEVNRKFFGPATRHAVRQLQHENGLAITGEVDIQTASAINTVAAAPRIQSPQPAVSTLDIPTDPSSLYVSFLVKGTVRQADGSPFVSGLVIAFDKGLRNERVLGRAITGNDGSYEIRYSAEQYRRKEQDSADLIVR